MTEKKKKHDENQSPPVDSDISEDSKAEESDANEDSQQPVEQPASDNDELEKAKSQAEEYLNSWKRAVADFQNYKKQQERDRQNWIAMSNAALILKMLPVLDDLEKAFGGVDPEVKKTPWFDGLALIKKKLEDTLREVGLNEIEAKGKKFDPAFHEAVLQEEMEGAESGTVIEVLQKGYELNGQVLRASMVKVAQ